MAAPNREQILARLELGERKQGDIAAGAGLAVAQYLTAAELSRSRRGLSFGPTTVPRRMASSLGAATIAKLLLPEYVVGNLLHGGVELGWEPFGYDWRYARLTFANLALQYARDLDHQGEAWALGFAPAALTALPRVVWLPDAGVRPQVWWNPAGRSGNDFSFGGELFIRPIYGRLEISVGMRDVLCLGNRGNTGLSCASTRFVNVGLADISGLLYWLGRTLGSDKTYDGAGGKLVDVPSQLIGIH